MRRVGSTSKHLASQVANELDDRHASCLERYPHKRAVRGIADKTERESTRQRGRHHPIDRVLCKGVLSLVRNGTRPIETILQHSIAWWCDRSHVENCTMT